MGAGACAASVHLGGMLGGSLTIARVAGIPIRSHWTFFVLLLWIVTSGVFRGLGISAGVMSGLFVVAVFLCVTLHELGHALAARAYGVHTRDITLLPIGGVASLERIPDRPLHEFVIAIAGPLVNVVIAAALWTGLAWREGMDSLLALNWLQNPAAAFLANLAAVNLWLVLFNLIPAFPMDGGRILRSALAAGLGRARATKVAATVGKVVAVGMAFVGLLAGHPMLLLIAMFVWLGATAEASATLAREALRRIPVRAAMVREYRALSADQTIRDAAAILLSSHQQDFPVTKDGDAGGEVVGVLPRMNIIRTLSERGPETRVGDVMLRDCKSVGPEDDLSEAAQAGYTSGCPLTPVTVDGRLVGLLTPETVGEFLLIKEAEGTMNGAGYRRSA